MNPLAAVPKGLGPPQVLVVEDLKPSREAVVRMLQRKKYEVRAAESGEVAVAEVGKRDPCLVLMDIDLGEGIDGIEAAEEIRRGNPLTSFVFITAHGANQDYRRRADASGFTAVDWISKPFTSTELLSRLGEEHARLWARTLRHNLPPRVVNELSAGREGGASGADADEHALPALTKQIDELYVQLGQLERRRNQTAKTKSSIAEIEKRLEELENREADEVERHYLRGLAVDPIEARALLAQAAERTSGR